MSFAVSWGGWTDGNGQDGFGGGLRLVLVKSGVTVVSFGGFTLKYIILLVQTAASRD